MTTAIGRVGLTNLQVGIKTWNKNGRKIDVEGSLFSTAAAGAYPSSPQLQAVIAERQRLSGYVDNYDEPVVPVVWDQCDLSVNGFYRVSAAEVNMQGSSLKTGVFGYRVTLEEVLGYGSPQFETIILGSGIAINGVTPEAWFAFPSIGSPVFSGEQFFRIDCRTVLVRTADTGPIQFTDCFQHFGAPNTPLHYWLTPEFAYAGAGKILVGSPLEIVVGTQIAHSPSNWRLDNGLVRVEPAVQNGGPDGQLDVSHYNGSAWSTPKRYVIEGISGPDQTAGPINGFTNLTVLRNSPETVSIRLSCRVNLGIIWGRCFLDLTLRIGDRNAMCLLTNDRQERWQVSRATNEAATALTGGIRATANDGESNRYVMAAPIAFTTDLTIGRIIATANSLTFPFSLGSEVGGSAASGSAAAQNLINQSYSGQTERRTVVSR